MTFGSTHQPRSTDGRFSSYIGSAPTVSLGEMPIVEKTSLSHVGSLRAEDKKSLSYEGQGLSVSQHPEAWQRIARLDGEVHAFSKPARMLDFHSLSDEQLESVMTHALENGWVERSDIHTVTYFDDEWDQEMRMQFTDYNEAVDEAEAIEGEVSTVAEWKYLNMPDSTARIGEVADADIVVAAWVNQERTDLDGVWWEDNLDVSRLSAPRGVIVPNRIESWLG